MTDSGRGSNPQIRPVEAFPMQIDGAEVTCLRDPQGLAIHPVFLNGPQAFLISQMTGANSLREIQASYFRRTAEILPMEALEELVAQLDDYRYLESPSFKLYYDALVREFRQEPSRPARYAGTAYEGDAEALRRQILGFFTGPGGPGAAPAPDPTRPARGLIAPHIDFHRGGPTYAHAYRALVDHPGADRFIIFGTCHSAMKRRFAITTKDFETPLGPATTDREFVRSLAARSLTDYFEDEFAHRGEHTIEFQTVCLRYVLQRDFQIIPILVGSFQDILASGKTAAEDPEIAAMVSAIAETAAEMPGRYCAIAAADLAHVGCHFGDPAGPSESSLREVARQDHKFLQLVAHGDAEGVFRFIAAEDDRRRVCGYPPIYMALRFLGNPSGKVLDYRQWADLQAGAAVTFAGAVLF
jgi:AmmeMemoRadiSam system protein B